MSGNKKKATKQPPVIQANEEYDLGQNFNKIKKYHSSNNAPTGVDGEQKYYNPPMDSNYSPESYYNIATDQFGFYNRLEDKITDLYKDNNHAHDDLRKEFEKKLDDVRKEIGKNDDSKKESKRWKIGIIISIVAIVIAYIVLPFRKSLSNEDKIEITQEKIRSIQTEIKYEIKNPIENNKSAIKEIRESLKENEDAIRENRDAINAILEKKKK